MLTKKNYFLISTVFFLLMYFFFGLTEFGFIDHFRNSYENSIVDPLSYVALFSVCISLYLVFFSNQIFNLWLRKIVSWFLPLSALILLAASPTRGGVVSFDRTDYAIALGVLLFSVTVIFALVQRFYFQR
mgnify:CR=1 FL=1